MARAFFGLALVAGPAACVEPFDGSNIQIDFATAVQTATRPGQVQQQFQPPVGTHYELYAADPVYQLDDQGQPVLGTDGLPLIDRTYMFYVTRFYIRPVIDRSSPCFIELEDTSYPGLHVTQFEAKVKEVTGITDPFAPGLPSEQVTDVLDAIRRNENLERVESDLKAVTSYDPFHYPAAAPAGQCPPTDAAAIPDPACRDDASNAQRLKICHQLWRDHPDLYEGSDKVFTLPLNGSYLGMVEGTNPINGGRVGGSSMLVDVNLVGHGSYSLNWQYDDADGDGTPDFPAELTADQRSAVGYEYMSGTPRVIARDVITVPLKNHYAPAIGADLAILPNLGHDDVHF
ncbi:MAG TPA: hypothetical protein VHE35_36840 [Kofleriaceae bacterium]|nr:hypothetical protein [Kofleriaceae bacterium]